MRVAAAFLLLAMGAPALDPGASAAARWVAGVSAVSVAAFGWFRLPRIGLRTDAEGARLVYPFSTRRVPWTRVERFEVKQVFVREFIYLVEPDGARRRVPGLQQNTALCDQDGLHVDDPVAHLNAHLESWRAGRS